MTTDDMIDFIVDDSYNTPCEELRQALMTRRRRFLENECDDFTVKAIYQKCKREQPNATTNRPSPQTPERVAGAVGKRKRLQR